MVKALRRATLRTDSRNKATASRSQATFDYCQAAGQLPSSWTQHRQQQTNSTTAKQKRKQQHNSQLDSITGTCVFHQQQHVHVIAACVFP